MTYNKKNYCLFQLLVPINMAKPINRCKSSQFHEWGSFCTYTKLPYLNAAVTPETFQSAYGHLVMQDFSNNLVCLNPPLQAHVYLPPHLNIQSTVSALHFLITHKKFTNLKYFNWYNSLNYHFKKSYILQWKNKNCNMP